MTWLKPVIIAFSMYSAIPMPRVEWDREGMRYALCAFPLVGLAVGGALWCWWWLCGLLKLGQLLAAAGMTLLPILVSGGIHMDGLCDAADAIASRQGPEKRLEILRDPRAGAFGVMGVCGCLLLSCGLWDTLLASAGAGAFGAVTVGFVLSRALSGLAVATFPLAKSSGLAHTFATGADKRAVILITSLTAGMAALGMVLLAPVPGLWGLAGGAAAVLHYRLVCRDFGGTTGDLAGYFLTLCELGILLGATLGQSAMG